MKQRPILFNGEMVRALLDGRKTQTRRIVKPAKDRNGSGCQLAPCEIAGEVNGGDYSLCPYGQPGDRLWVREAHAFVPEPAYRRSTGIVQTINPADDYEACVYRENFNRARSFPWRPSIHMPRWASRITLEIVSVRVERLNDISAKDALEEGIALCQQPQEAFRQLWESIHSPEGWSANPWVWVVEFRRIDQ